MSDPTLYVFLNKSLNMSSGKAAAQVAHASLQIASITEENTLRIWYNGDKRTVLVMEARDDLHIRNISDYLNERGYKTSIVIDEGINEIPPYSITAMSVEIVDREKDSVQNLFCMFKLYREESNMIFFKEDKKKKFFIF